MKMQRKKKQKKIGKKKKEQEEDVYNKLDMLGVERAVSEMKNGKAYNRDD